MTTIWVFRIALLRLFPVVLWITYEAVRGMVIFIYCLFATPPEDLQEKELSRLFELSKKDPIDTSIDDYIEMEWSFDTQGKEPQK